MHINRYKQLLSITTCLILSFTALYSQNTFYKFLPAESAFGVTEIDSNYHVLSNEHINGFGLDSTYNIVHKLSLNGDILSDWTFAVDSSNWHSSNLYHSTDFNSAEKWYGLIYYPLSGNPYKNIYKFSSKFDTIDKIISFPYSSTTSLYGIKYFADDGSLTFGQREHLYPYSDYIKISKIDTSGNNLWHCKIKPSVFSPIYYPDTNRSLSYYDICRTEDKGYFVSSYYSQDPSDNRFFLISKLDSNGNNTWNKLVSQDYYTSAPGNIIYQDTNSYLVTWTGQSLATHDSSTIGLGKGTDSLSIWMGEMDLSGNFKWKKQFYNEATNCDTIITNAYYMPYDILKLSDGNYLICIDFFMRDATLIKVTPLGEVIWNRRVRILEDNTDLNLSFLKITNLKETQDGGFIGAGQYFSTLSTMFPNGFKRAAVIKLDKYGCLEPGCHLEGCTDPSATNYNPTAIYDCGCQYAPCPDQHKVTVNIRHFKHLDDISYKLFLNGNAIPILESAVPNNSIYNAHDISTRYTCFDPDCSNELELYIDYDKAAFPNTWIPFATNDYTKPGYFAYFQVLIDDSLVLDIGDKIHRKHDTTFNFYYCPYDTTSPIQIDYSIYPNPATEETSITIPTKDYNVDDQFLLMIYDKQGKVVLAKKIKATKTTISLNKLSQGVYTAMLRKNDFVVYTEQIIKI